VQLRVKGGEKADPSNDRPHSRIAGQNCGDPPNGFGHLSRHSGKLGDQHYQASEPRPVGRGRLQEDSCFRSGACRSSRGRRGCSRVKRDVRMFAAWRGLAVGIAEIELAARQKCAAKFSSRDIPGAASWLRARAIRPRRRAHRRRTFRLVPLIGLQRGSATVRATSRFPRPVAQQSQPWAASSSLRSAPPPRHAQLEECVPSTHARNSCAPWASRTPSRRGKQPEQWRPLSPSCVAL
jgi:hypothetical protein